MRAMRVTLRQRATTTETSEEGTVLTVSCSSDTSSGSCCHLAVASGTAARLQPALKVTKCTSDVYVTLHLFYSYGFAVEFIDDCFSLCSNLVLSMNDSMSKFCLKVLVGLMSSLISFPVSLCTDQD